MTGKEWIENVTETLENKLKRIERDEERVNTLQAELFGVTAIVYDVDKVQTSCDGDKLARKCAEIEELNNKIMQEMEDYAIYRADALKTIDKYIPIGDLAMVIADRHIFFMTNQQISQELSINERAIHYRFNKAYQLLNNIYVLEKYRKKTKSVDIAPQNGVN